VVRIERTGVPDPTQFDAKSDYHDPKSRKEAPTWLMCEVSFVERFEELVALETLRSDAALANLLILRRGNRLSITPLEQAEFERIRALGAGGAGRAGAGWKGTAAKDAAKSGAAAKPSSRAKGSIRVAK
jgi:predicted RNA-binding protein with PUA-like domain